jgi:hypothetical protein
VRSSCVGGFNTGFSGGCVFGIGRSCGTGTAGGGGCCAGIGVGAADPGDGRTGAAGVDAPIPATSGNHYSAGIPAGGGLGAFAIYPALRSATPRASNGPVPASVTRRRTAGARS